MDRVYRGDVGAEVQFRSAMSGASCGLEGMAVDRRYVVFLNGGGADRTVTLCGGTAPASPRLEAAVERLAGPPVRPVASEPSPPAREPAATPAAADTSRTSVRPWGVVAGVLGVALLGGVGTWLRRRSS